MSSVKWCSVHVATGGKQFCLYSDCEIGRVTEECRTVSQVGDLDGNFLL